MKLTKTQLKTLIREEKAKLLREFGDDLDHDTKASMVMEAVQQNLNDPSFVNWLFEEMGLGMQHNITESNWGNFRKAGRVGNEMDLRIASVLPSLMANPTQDALSDAWFDWEDTGEPGMLGISRDHWDDAIFAKIEEDYDVDPWSLFGF